MALWIAEWLVFAGYLALHALAFVGAWRLRRWLYERMLADAIAEALAPGTAQPLEPEDFDRWLEGLALQARGGDSMGARDVRQLRLGELIAMLRERPANEAVRFDFGGLVPLTEPDSYRGYYEQLAIGFACGWCGNGGKDAGVAANVGQLLAGLESAVGRTFQGYKGGDYTMTEDTPLWVSNHGDCSGTVVTGLVPCDGLTVIQTRHESDQS